MAKFQLKDPQTGKTIVIKSDIAPTQEEAEELFYIHREFDQKENLKKEAINVLSAPSRFFGGILKDLKEPEKLNQDLNLQNPIVKSLVGGFPTTVGLNPRTFVAGVKGIKDKTPVYEELPKFLGVQPETPAGTVIGLAGEIATPDILDVLVYGKLARKMSEKVGEKLIEKGKTVAVKSIKPTKTQLTKFVQTTGRKLEDVIADKNLAGNVLENTVEQIRKVQESFDDLAVNSGVKIDYKTIMDAIDGKITELSGGLSKVGNKTAIKALNNLKTDLSEALPDVMDATGKVDISELTNLRRIIDDSIPNQEWMKYLSGDISARTVTRNVLQDIIRNATEELGLTDKVGRSLKQIGKELNTLIAVENIAKTQSNLGKGTNLLRLTDLLAGGVGAATGGSDQDKIKNALITAGFARFANSPKVISSVSNIMLKGGQKLMESDKFPKIIELILRSTKEEVLKGVEKATD